MAERENKKRRGRRAYLEDFHKTATGEYVYEGEVHHFRPGRLTWKQAMLRLWLCTGVMIAGVAAAGVVPAAGPRNTVYVVLPYALSLVAVVALTWLMARLTAGGEHLRDYVYKATGAQFTPRGVFVMVCAALSAAGQLVHLLLGGAGDRLAGSLALVALQGAVFAAALVWWRLARTLNW